MGFKLIAEREVLQRAAFEQGPRITKIQTIETPTGQTVEVAFWTENGRLVYLTDYIPLVS